ncbi:MAG: pseudouridine synthase [Metamycoplasmataceae bacterium]
MRLDKFISLQKITKSRNESRFFIKNKKIFVDNNVIVDPSFLIDPLVNEIKFNGNILKYDEYIYIALNKPKNYVCANKDNFNKSILELIEKKDNKNLHIVGRLDKDTTGLILLTNNGDWTHKLKTPKTNLEKEYYVLLERELTNQMIKDFLSPMKLDGKALKPVKIHQISSFEVNVILVEGKFHQIKRMFHNIGNNVIDLKRIRIGNLKLDDLKIKEKEYVKIDGNIINSLLK